jgi:hypothetical protein
MRGLRLPSGLCGCGGALRSACTAFWNSGSFVGSEDLAMVTTNSTIRIGKLDAARRQLRTAITLWFNGGDPVSVHTLAYAAYEIIHTISKKRDPNRRDLLFDSLLIKDEYRTEYNALVRRHANFFKHADKEGDAIIEFNPELSELFILFAILGRELCGESPTEEESIFLWWFQINNPRLLTEQGQKTVADLLPINNLESLKILTKHEFFQVWREASRSNERRGIPARRHTLLRLP